MTKNGAWELLRADLDRYVYLSEIDVLPESWSRWRWRGALRAIVLCKGFQATVLFRLGHALYLWHPAGPVGRVARATGRIAHLIATKFIESTTGISIASGAEIGAGLYIGHFGGVIIGVVRMGENCNVSHGVTIGRSGRIGERGRPMIGDRTWIGPGAVLAGGIHVGEDAVIGANVVVTADVPARCTALAAPVRPIRARGSFDMIAYRTAPQDACRALSLEIMMQERTGPAVGKITGQRAPLPSRS